MANRLTNKTVALPSIRHGGRVTQLTWITYALIAGPNAPGRPLVQLRDVRQRW